MQTEPAASEFRVEKQRIDALLTLANGDSAPGHFFVARNSAHTAGPERVGELLNAEAGFFPFETLDGHGPRPVRDNRRHAIGVALADNEARRDPGHEAPPERLAPPLLSNGAPPLGPIPVFP